MAKIGIFPLNEISHINATLGFAKKLQRLGHRVCYLASLEFEDHICAQQMEFTPFLPRTALRKTAATPSGSNQLNNHIFDLLLRGEFDESLREKSFDLLVVDSYAPHMALVAYKLGLAAVCLCPTVSRQRNSWMTAPGTTMTPNTLYSRLKIRLWWCAYDLTKFKRTGARETHFRRTLRELAIAARYPLEHLDFSGDHPCLDLIPEFILCPEAFDFPREKSRGKIHYIGANVALDRKEDVSFPWERICTGKTLIYCSLGTLSHRFPNAREVLQKIIDTVALREDWQLVVSVGVHLSAADFQAIPENVILVQRAPQLEILQRASLAIIHGGLNSVKECILLGVPMLAIPWANPRNAIRVAHHGLGLMERVANVSTDRMPSLIEQILRDPAFKMRVGQMQELFAAQEKSAAEIPILESLLRSAAEKQVAAL